MKRIALVLALVGCTKAGGQALTGIGGGLIVVGSVSIAASSCPPDGCVAPPVGIIPIAIGIPLLIAGALDWLSHLDDAPSP